MSSHYFKLNYYKQFVYDYNLVVLFTMGKLNIKLNYESKTNIIIFLTNTFCLIELSKNIISKLFCPSPTTPKRVKVNP